MSPLGSEFTGAIDSTATEGSILLDWIRRRAPLRFLRSANHRSV